MKLPDVGKYVGMSGLIPDNNQEGGDNALPDKNHIPPEDREIKYSWTALSRSGKSQISQKASRTLIVIGIVVALILIAMQEFIFIIGILSIIFVSYMLSQVPPEQIKYEITNMGVTYENFFYRWEEIEYFFFTKQQDLEIAALDLKKGMPRRLYLTVLPDDKDKIKQMLHDHIAFLEQEPRTFMDDAIDWVSNKLNLNDDEPIQA